MARNGIHRNAAIDLLKKDDIERRESSRDLYGVLVHIHGTATLEPQFVEDITCTAQAVKEVTSVRVHLAVPTTLFE